MKGTPMGTTTIRENPADTCRRNGWDVGTRLVGDEGYGPTVIRVTAIGESHILAVRESHKGEPEKHPREGLWTLDCREWTEWRPRRLAIGDRLYGYPCDVEVRSMFRDGATVWCKTHSAEHYVSVRLYERGRGPWKLVESDT